jgi:tetratricopeptide (TPR) repeat protein
VGGPIAAGVIYQQKIDTLAAKQLAESNAEAAREAEEKAKANAAAAAAAEAIAKRNEEVAIAAKEETEVQKNEAEKSAELAQSQNKVALDTLRQVTFAINRELKDRPRLQSLRKSLIGEVTQGMDRTKSVGFDPQATHMIAAGTYSNLGRLNLDIGRPTAAMEDFKRCLDVFDHLDSIGQLPSAFRNRAQIHMYMGEAAKGMGNLELAERHFKESLKFRTQWLESTPVDGKEYNDIPRLNWC